jgi:hypothetical protein
MGHYINDNPIIVDRFNELISLFLQKEVNLSHEDKQKKNQNKLQL